MPMYRIIGADGKQYGPVSAAQLAQWLAEGRLNGLTQVCAEGSTEWKPFAQFPELASPPPIAPTAYSPPVGTVVGPADQVRGPAIFMLILSVLGLCGSLLGAAAALFQLSLPGLMHMPQREAHLEGLLALCFSLPANCLGCLASVVSLLGALQMLKLKSYGLAMTAAILMLLPCGQCCCLLNIAAGVWALVVLSRPEVRTAFH